MKTLKDVIWCNMTPHEIVVRMDDGTNHRIPPFGEVLRLETRSKQVAMTSNGIRINEVRPTAGAEQAALEKIREHIHREDGRTCMVVVSGIALDWIYPLLDAEESYLVVSPDTSPGCAIREPSGRMVAVRALRIGS